MNAVRTIQALVLAVSLAAAWPLAAQQTAPDTLLALRDEFRAQVIAGSRQLTEQYIRALGKLEDELAAAGDYEEARAALDRRLELEKVIGATADVSAGSLPLLATAARLSGGVSTEDGVLTEWESASAGAEWSLQKLTPGRYAFELFYTQTSPLPPFAPPPPPKPGQPPPPPLSSRDKPAESARFRLSEVSLLAGAEANVRELDLPRSDPPTEFKRLITPPLTISRSTITLRLQPVQAYPANEIRIKDIRLVPVTTAAAVPLAATTVPTTSDRDIIALREVFQKQLIAARMPLLQSHLSALDSFAARPSVAQDRELVEDVLAERQRTSQRLASPAMVDGSKRQQTVGMAALDGFEDLQGARLLDDPASTSERLRVEHEGRRFWIKLAWVRGLPASPADKEALHHATRHFGISEEEALAVGLAAHEFVRGYLEGRSIRLLVRQPKRNEEPAPALVFVDDVSLLQTVLIDRGFAAFAPPPGGGQRPVVEGAMIKLLGDHEAQARKREPAPGAWAFHEEGGKQP